MFANIENKGRIQKFFTEYRIQKQEFAFLGEAKEVKVIYSIRDKCEDISVSPHCRVEEYQCEHSGANIVFL